MLYSTKHYYRKAILHSLNGDNIEHELTKYFYSPMTGHGQ